MNKAQKNRMKTIAMHKKSKYFKMKLKS